MKLYYSPGACSLSPHIALREAGLPFDLVKVDAKSKLMADNRDFRVVNPFGYVPALELDTGEVITEGPAIVQYIADRVPEAGLAPANGTLERTRLHSALGLVNSEIHKSIGALFDPTLDDDGKAAAIAKVESRLDILDRQLGDASYVANDRYSVADAYLFVVLRWLRFFRIDLARWPRLAGLYERVAARPAVQAALVAEGIS